MYRITINMSTNQIFEQDFEKCNIQRSVNRRTGVWENDIRGTDIFSGKAAIKCVSNNVPLY